jgi:hypothetical protein
MAGCWFVEAGEIGGQLRGEPTQVSQAASLRFEVLGLMSTLGSARSGYNNVICACWMNSSSAVGAGGVGSVLGVNSTRFDKAVSGGLGSLVHRAMSVPDLTHS